jgi:hypothetical protein
VVVPQVMHPTCHFPGVTGVQNGAILDDLAIMGRDTSEHLDY